MVVSSPAVFAEPNVIADRRPDGTIELRSADRLGPFAPSIGHAFRAQAAARPEQVLVAERDGDGWREVSWGAARPQVDAVAQALLDRGLGPQRPLMVLSGNSIAHLLLILGAHTAGIPILSISTAYSLASRDHKRVRDIAERFTPGLVFAEDERAYKAALDAVGDVAGHRIAGAAGVRELLATPAGGAVQAALAEVGPDTVAKILFTSGSTGTPKGVITTHGMLCSNQQALAQVWPFVRDEPPILVDWLPWSHTFGGNHNLNQVLVNGGTLYIDDGRPTASTFERTITALRSVPPTVYYNVPAAYALLAPRLEVDRDFAAAFFSRLRFMFYAAAALPEDLWERLRTLADEFADHPVPLTAAWGTTETAPGATTAHFASARCGCIGVPLPGTTIRLVPDGEKLELRVSGPNVTPGYHGDPKATKAAFDSDGFYRTGDAARLTDPQDPNQGLMFDGRLAEDFKLASGTWVRVGALRTALVSAAGGVLSDAVIGGHDGDQVIALAWVNRDEARRVCGLAEDEALLSHPALVKHLAASLATLNTDAGSAGRVQRLFLLDEPASIDAGEITDKGYVNQRAVLRRRADTVARVLSDPVDPTVIVPAGS